MDIWMRWNRQSKPCSYDQCEDRIAKGDPVVVGRTKKHTPAGIRTYNFSWHPHCWLSQAMDHLQSIPEEQRIPKRGRKHTASDPELRATRLALLRRRAALMHRQKHLALLGCVEKVMELELAKQDLIPLIQATGPVPKGWIIE